MKTGHDWKRLLPQLALAAAVVALVATTPVGLVIALLIELCFGAIRTLVVNWKEDGPATAWNFLLAILRVGLCVAPTVALAFRMQRWRVLLLPWSLIFVVAIPFSLRSCPTTWHWLALILLSGAGLVMTRWLWLRWGVALPLIMTLVVPWIDHGWDAWWTPERLAVRCASNPGVRPANLRTDQLAPAYYGLHQFDGNDWILTGENERDGRFLGFIGGGNVHTGSWWLSRGEDGRLKLGEASRATGNLWNGCKLNDTLWLLRANFVLSVQREPDGREHVESQRVEMRGFDAAGILCDPVSNSLFFMEGMDGHLWQKDSTGFHQRPYEPGLGRNVGGFLIRREKDGRFIYMNPYQIAVYEPQTGKVLEAVPTALASINIDVCQANGAVAVADLTGRVRVFTLDEQGHYRFGWGRSLFAPRRVRFSPDCQHLAVTSANDQDVWLVDTTTHEVSRQWQLGPSIRGIAFMRPRELDVVDACTVTSLEF